MADTPGIGHNTAPHDQPGYHWRRHCWQQAKRDAAPAALSVALVRMRTRRAGELGLSYVQYAAIRHASGRDPRALLFTPSGLGLRLTRHLSLPDPVRAKLAGLRHCHLLAMAPEGETPAAFLDELRAVSALPFAAAAAHPAPSAGWSAIRAALRPALAPLELPGDATLLIDADLTAAAGWAAAIQAPFLPAAAYFGTAPG